MTLFHEQLYVMKSVISNKHSAKPKEEYVTDDSLSQTASCDEKAGVVEVKASLDEMVDDESSSIGSKRKEICDDKSDVNQELELKHCLYSTKNGMQALQMTYKEEVFNLGYQRVLEENRKLYNQVQDLEGSSLK
ncbi:hypothetical protein V6N11_035245 [Hibiscus sabdariffa]|uniref:Uncharacterized protein n=1 Tax=Hibiscus sabdariffa TaxID=183260 RepID=A0ABR2R083_9ROSI